MGISRARAWLAVVALSLGSVRGNTAVTFEPTAFTGSWDPNSALFSFDHIINHSFTWTSSVTVEGIEVWSVDDGYLLAQAVPSDSGSVLPSKSRTWPAPPRTGESEDTHWGRPGRRNPQDNIGGLNPRPELVFESNPSGGEVHFTNVDGVPSGQVLYFNATWANGASYSRFFAAAGTRLTPDGRLYSRSPAFLESVTPSEGGGIQTTLVTTATASSEPTNVSDGNLGGEPNRPTAGDAISGGSGGLATGAVIGIAVGCAVAGLLLILGLVWYLLHRRRQKKAMHPVDSTYGSGNRGEELMAEKEAAADVDVAPHSPYTDEAASGGAGPSGTYPDSVAQGDAVAAGATTAPNLSHLQDPPRSFTPYSDRPSVGGGGAAAAAAAAAAAGTPSLRAPSLAQTDEARVSVPSPIPGRATPRGLTTPYAHLVEEGMTEDEIRRLEEEERQLDAAIEQAGRR